LSLFFTIINKFKNCVALTVFHRLLGLADFTKEAHAKWQTLWRPDALAATFERDHRCIARRRLELRGSSLHRSGLVQRLDGAERDGVCWSCGGATTSPPGLPGNLSARSIQLGTAVAPSLPLGLQRMRGPKDGTVASSGQRHRSLAGMSNFGLFSGSYLKIQHSWGRKMAANRPISVRTERVLYVSGA
jgi:hypothetical protein